MPAERFEKEKYARTECFTSAKKQKLLLLAVVLPLCLVEVCVYLLGHDYANIFATIFKTSFLFEIFILAAGMFAFISVALLAKAALLSLFAAEGFKSVKFKIIKESQKPHCCLTEPIKVHHYRLCLAVYIIFALVAPYAVALAIGDFIFVIASLICVLFSAGDLLFFIALLWRGGSCYVQDFEGIMLYCVYERT